MRSAAFNADAARCAQPFEVAEPARLNLSEVAMGQGCSSFRDILDPDLEENDWRSWAKHPGMRQYAVVEELGEGAFSKVRAVRTPLASNLP